MSAAGSTVLIPGGIHARVRERIEAEFDAVSIAAADAALMTPEARAKISGIACATVITSDFIDAFPNLSIIASFGVGYDAVDAKHAATRGIMVTNTPDVLSDEVADTTVGLLLNTLREFPKAEAYLRAGRWVAEGSYPLTSLTLRGRTVGIFGLGRIGLAIARRLEAFGLPINYHTRTKRNDVDYPWHDNLAGLASVVDTLIVVVPGGAATEKAVNADILAALGPKGVLISVGRGSTIDEPALIAALADHKIAAAGLDVFADEPNVPQALMELPNVSLLPHVASASVSTRNAMADLVVDNLAAWLDGRPAITAVPECAGLDRKPA
ncbi:lactate dehydrogenase-like oxidoreductase [Hoeflea sp. IMCC20628]|uniref:2-hydroxyacid dehydrogenase n=1 Tax=Hoeflea sp. IMCC20628 TaxID=1620421 RepID=UPI00063ACFD3|nr:2-hydroxyacid dehydrogenase [Hoeflea sp. IMCC20628]AKH99048.1 lactate dehydrogenase-like oxidoreductase [Hoeflea sp. IMCC20628]